MTKLFALTTRGLEPVSAGEIGALPRVTVEQVAYRRIFLNYKENLEALLHLKTVDDVFLEAARWKGIGRPRSALEALKAYSAELRLDKIVGLCRQIRALPSQPAFAITANFVGKRNYSTDEIKAACAAGVATRNGWTYSEKDEDADLNVRVFIEGETALVGIRLGALPVGRRAYKQSNIPGSLKPAVAAALALLVDVAPGMQVLDPCCGAGTILIEAFGYGAKVRGGDVEGAAIEAAQQNASEAGATLDLKTWDAQALPIDSSSVERVISNLPWGREVPTEMDLKTLYKEIGKEIQRVLVPGGQAALLTNQPELLQIEGLQLDRQIEISLYGQNPTIMIWKKKA